MDLPTYTNIWRIEKRLYKLYDLRLPVPMPITWIGIFAAITVPYVVLLFAVGVPFSHTLVWLYVLPPGALTWLTTRPVIEGKRLPELVSSQVRYLAEPRAWCRMAPVTEKDEIVVSVRVWHGRPPKVRAKKVSARDQLAEAARPASAQPAEAGTATPVAVAAPGPDPAAASFGHDRVPARASAGRAEVPVKARPGAQAAWSAWPHGSGLQTGAPGLAGDDAHLPDRRGPISVTPGQLGDIQAWWGKLDPAAHALRELGFAAEGDQVAAIASAMSAARFAVQIPCVGCRIPVPRGAGIGGPADPQPGGVVCDTCSTLIDRRALADPADCGRNAGEYSD